MRASEKRNYGESTETCQPPCPAVLKKIFRS
ncbi:hypothetical protein HDG38_001986 [Paraburkholderia sp. WSM4177]|nr:hypothetical protein [Paraburkholderia sp. WSM4177]MBB5484404.1 hypothetical protein [Paraburkholderia sp. WSM4180]